jgi:hypothetical protein
MFEYGLATNAENKENAKNIEIIQQHNITGFSASYSFFVANNGLFLQKAMLFAGMINISLCGIDFFYCFVFFLALVAQERNTTTRARNHRQ